MISVSITPEAPTRQPATTSTVLSIAKPANDAATPEKALSSDMITGISPPPIDTTMVIPSIRKSTVITIIRIAFTQIASKNVYPNIAKRPIPTKIALIRFLEGITVCFLNIFPESLPQATTEPVKVIAPTAIVSPPVNVENASKPSSTCALLANSAIATKSEERPPKPLNKATSSGIPVISTFLDHMAPIIPPTTIPAITTIYPIITKLISVPLS